MKNSKRRFCSVLAVLGIIVFSLSHVSLKETYSEEAQKDIYIYQEPVIGKVPDGLDILKPGKKDFKPILERPDFRISENWQIKPYKGKSFWASLRGFPLPEDLWKSINAEDTLLAKETRDDIFTSVPPMANEWATRGGIPPECRAHPLRREEALGKMKEYFDAHKTIPAWSHLSRDHTKKHSKFRSITDHERGGLYCFKRYRKKYPEFAKKLEEESIKLHKEGKLWHSSPGDCLFHHHGYEWGSLLSWMQTVAACTFRTNIQFAFNRGAARQYNRPFGVDVAGHHVDGYPHYFYWTSPPNLKGFPVYRGGMSFLPYHSGKTLSIYRRTYFLSYLFGSSFVWTEYFSSVIKSDLNDDGILELSPLGEVMNDFVQFTKVHPDRGITYTPVGVMLDFDHGWGPHWSPYLYNYKGFRFEKKDWMIEEFFNTIYPWKRPLPMSKRVFDVRYGDKEDSRIDVQQNIVQEKGYWVNTPFGDIFDGITSNAKEETINAYPVIIIVGDIHPEWASKEKVAHKLIKYVKDGGTLVVNATQLKNFYPEDFLGVKIGDKTGKSNVSKCLLDNEEIRSREFEYQEVEAGRAKVLAATDKGAPLITINKYGKGHCILTTPLYMLDKENLALPLLSHLLHHLIANLLPVEVSGDIQYFVNKNKNGWLLTLVNNKGIYKDCSILEGKFQPNRAKPVIVVPEETALVDVTFRGRAKSICEWTTTGTKRIKWKKEKNKARMEVIVPPGDIKVIEIRI